MILAPGARRPGFQFPEQPLLLLPGNVTRSFRHQLQARLFGCLFRLSFAALQYGLGQGLPRCLQVRRSIVVSISAYHAEDPGSIPGGGVCTALLLLALLPPIGAQLFLHIFQERTPGFEPATC